MFDRKIAFSRNDQIKNILVTYGLCWFWVAIVATSIKYLMLSIGVGAELVSQPPILSVLPNMLNEHWPEFAVVVQGSIFLRIFLILIFAPVFEEIVFRLFPLTLVQRSRPEVIFAVQLAICGVIFGYMHGSPLNVFIQGVLGFMLGRLYIANSSSMRASWGSCAAVHAMYNLTVLLVWSA